MVYLDGRSLRQAIRQGNFRLPTTGQAPNFVQGNLVILPRDWAYDFLLFAQRNPKPCPIIEVGEIGDPYTHFIADQADIRTDIPRYRVYKEGKLIEERHDIRALWQDDWVFFILGCSFSFESGLIQAGLEIRHIAEKRNVPMYTTNIPCHAAGKFASSPMVVSMRPFSSADALKAVTITREYPSVHGSPVHIGNPEGIGIKNINKPDFGDAVTIYPNEIPVFWACGVTPQMAAFVSKPPLMITHAPGYMFVGDLKNEAFKI